MNVWDEISQEKNLDIAFLKEHKDMINWKVFSRHGHITEEVVNIFEEKLFRKQIIKNPNWEEKAIRKQSTFFHWSLFFKQYPSFTIDLLETIKESIKQDLPWEELSKNQNLPIEVIRHYQKEVCWEEFSRYNEEVTESFLSEFSHCVDWNAVSYRCKLSKQFVLRFIDKINLTSLEANLYCYFTKKDFEEFHELKEYSLWDELDGEYDVNKQMEEILQTLIKQKHAE